jgi:dienelactone hydrolase
VAKRRLARLLRLGGAVLAVVGVAGGAYTGLVAWRSYAHVDLPHPAGGHPVGRVGDTATDPGRGGRRLSIWTWYPAAARTGTPAAYAPGRWAGLAIGLPLGETRLERVRDPAREQAAPAPGRFPLVVLLPGLGFAAPQYAVLAEDLASRGYVVVGVTPTGSANLTVLDGRAVGPTTEGNPSDFAGDQTVHDRALAGALLDRWVGDARFAAASAATLTESSALAGHVDRSRLAYVGHSFGGSTALQACHEDRKCTAAVNLDGALYGAVATDGLDVPSLLVGHDGSCITGDCAPTGTADRADAAAAATFASASTGAVRRATVPRTGHLDFTDDGVYYWAWPLHTLLGLGDADGRRALAQTGALIGAALHDAGM